MVDYRSREGRHVGSGRDGLDRRRNRCLGEEGFVRLKVHDDIGSDSMCPPGHLCHPVRSGFMLRGGEAGLPAEPVDHRLDLVAVRSDHDPIHAGHGSGGSPGPLDEGAPGDYLQGFLGDPVAADPRGKNAEDGHRTRISGLTVDPYTPRNVMRSRRESKVVGESQDPIDRGFVGAAIRIQ